MKLKLLIFSSVLLFFAFFYSCTKKTDPTTTVTVTDTVTITKTDTVTVYPPSDTTINLTKGLLLYLNFNGSIADSSGNNNPTEAIGGNVLTYDAHGYANSAFGGNGTGQRIKVTNNGSIQFDTAFSLSYDFMINAYQQQVFVSMADPVNAYGPSFVSDESIPGLQNLSFFASDVTASCDAIGPTHLENPAALGDTSIVPQVGAWYNVINIYHKGTIQTYINGQLVHTLSGPGTADLLCSNSQVIIGGWWDGSPLTVNGKMDEVRLYNRVLTPHEITTLAQHFQVTSESVKPAIVTHK
jgi:hypothetical protein